MSAFLIFVVINTALTVRGQTIGVVCRASVNCTGGPGDDLGRTTERGCCVDNPLGMAYVVSEGNCTPCIVLGFFEDSFTGVEQGPGHSVQVGYQKGAQEFRQNLVFRVESISGTARGGDYTVNNRTASALFDAANPDNVVVTFRVDTIAQEPNETFTLTLDPFQTVLDTPRDGLFFLNTIEMTIVDNDNVEFLFTEDEFRANELGPGGAVSLMPVRVSKNVRIASQIELVVVPLTVREAMATSLPLPPNIPDDDSFSPPFANLNDFNNASVTLIFEPDEDGTPMNERGAPIPIVDDAINEATEQVFVVELQLVSSLDPYTVDLCIRPSSLCRIIDNDPIRIGFELPGYTYVEPKIDEIIDQFFMSPTGLPVNGPIYLAKEDNVTSEQTFLLSIQATDSAPSGTNIQPATLHADYRITMSGQTSVTLTFLATDNMINFQFTLFPDTLPEGTEAFRASVSPQNTRVRPNGSASEIFVFIEDDDPIIIGFANTSYTVDETIGMFEVTVQVFSPPDGETLPASVILVIQTVSGSAIGGSDYQEIFAVDLNPFLIFDNNARQQMFSVAITNDSFFEMDVEDFSLELRFNPYEAPPSNVQLRPNVTVVEIIDNDAPVEIGFLNTSYTVSAGESDGQVNIQIGVINGTLKTSVAMNFFINQSQFVGDSLRVDKLILNPTTTVINLSLAVTDYVFEFSESVVANITLVGEPIQIVTLDPASAVINIDALTIGVTSTKYIVNESDGDVTITVGVRGGANRCNKSEWTVNYIIRSISAQFTEDYNATELEGVIRVSTSQPASVTVMIVDDDVFKSEEVFQIQVFLPASEDRNCVILQPSVIEITILDNDMVVIGFVPDDNYAVTEGVDGFVNLTVELLDGELGRDVVVEVDIAPGGTATNGSDFVISGDQFLTFGPDVRSNLISIDIVDDNVFEAKSENLLVNLSTSTTGVRLSNNTADLTIQDNDMVTIGFDSTTYTVRESDGSVALSVELMEGMFGDISVNVRLNTINGSANASLDYDNVTMVLNFSSAVTMETVNLNILDDDVLEINETFRVVLELVSLDNDGRVKLQPNETEVSIVLDNDTVVIGFDLESYTVSEGLDNFADITVKLINGSLGQEVMVTVATQNGSAKGGEDFMITDYQLTFSPSVSSRAIPINITSDGNFEETENFSVILSVSEFRLQFNTEFAVNLRHVCMDERVFSVSNDSVGRDQAVNIDLDRIFVSNSQMMNGIVFSLAANESERVSVGPAMTTIAINDSDTITIGFTDTIYSVNECDGPARLTIKVINQSLGVLQRDITVLLSTRDRTAVAGTNYEGLTNHSLTFNSTKTEATVDIFIINATNETQPEVDEEFIVSLSFPGENIPRVTLEPDNATVAIYEINGRIGFTPQHIEVNESTGIVNLTVELSGQICGEVEISFFNDSSFNSTVGDYDVITESPLILTTEFPNATISIDIIDDVVTESAESFVITLSFQGEPIPRVTLDPNTTTITILASDSLPTTDPETTSVSVPRDLALTVIGSTLGAISVLLIIGIVLVIVFIFWFNRRSAKRKLQAENEDTTNLPLRNLSVQSSFKLNLPPHLIIHSSNIKMTENIGQGEFGVVYKGYLLKDRGQTITAAVAIKTLKGFYDSTAVRDMLKECSKMSTFDHPNVLTMNGVCLDGGPAPFIIMPFMMNGSLLAYLKKNRATLVISGNDDEEGNVRKQLMDMCLQVARGMEYLAKMKVVHRDLAARNCMIDMNYVIKVADFGLSESVGTKEYFRQDKSSAVKLPLKWLAPESLEDYIFSEKSDVWAYGVTCWEIFTAGKVPYATVNLNNLPRMLSDGYRLEKPANDACDGEIYALILQCWEMEPKGRPTFSDLVSSLSQSLEAMVGYMDVGAFGQVDTRASESGVSELSKDHKSSEKEPSQSKADECEEVKLELASVSETNV